MFFSGIKGSESLEPVLSDASLPLANKKILLIPLDSRPVNTSYPTLLGNLTGCHILLPTRGLDHFMVPADYGQLKNFLSTNITNVDAVIISLPEWLNGGIIEARDCHSYINNQDRLEELKTILSQYPEKKVYLLSLIPREMPSYKLDAYKYKEQILAYSQLYDEFTHAQNPMDKFWIQREMEKIEQSIPKPYISDYLQLFDENYKLHAELMNWVESGIADELLIGMDDTNVKGITKITEKKTRDLMQQKGLPNVSMMSGADELSALIIARYKNELLQSGSQYNVSYSNIKDRDRIFPYDGKTIGQIIKEKEQYVQPLQKNNIFPLRLYIHSSNESLEPLTNWANTHHEQIKGVANLSFANTDKTWMEQYFQQKLDRKIESYSGWNTGANTIGLLVAHMEIIKDLPNWNGEHEKWMILRYIEDYYFNLIKRNEYNGTYPLNYTLTLSESKDLLSDLLGETNQMIKRLSVVTRQDGHRFSTHTQYNVSGLQFPWDRIFEISYIFKKLTY